MTRPPDPTEVEDAAGGSDPSGGAVGPMPVSPAPPTQAWPAPPRSEVPEPDAPLLRHVRRRLVAWSAATTLVILVTLGVGFYTIVATAIEQGSIGTLRERAAVLTRGRIDTGLVDGSAPGGAIAFQGPGSGTYAILVGPNGMAIGGRPLPAGLPVTSSVRAALTTTGQDVRTADVGGTPVRVLSQAVTLPGGPTVVLQVAQIITAERQTLATLLLVLVVGGVIALVAATLGGAAYASRALVPIRDSLRRQREFAADASHELRTPLAVVRSNVEYLQRHPEARVGDVGEVMTDVREEVDRMTTLVEDLLLLARTDSGGTELEPSSFDLAVPATEAVDALAPLAAARGVVLRCNATPTPIVGDRARLRQLVRLLVDNALKHSPVGGVVAVTVAPRAGGGATLDVDDDGPGIRPEHLGHVFERFWRAPDAPGGGSGLGLSIAEWIADRHRGSIEASNRTPHGARFEVRLPAGRP